VDSKRAEIAEGTEGPALNTLSYAVIGAAIAVHRELGPGLLESVYRSCLARQLASVGVEAQTEVLLPARYQEMRLERAYRVDLLVDHRLIVEVKSLSVILPVHKAQLLTYLKFAGIRVGLLFNFNVTVLRQGIYRISNT